MCCPRPFSGEKSGVLIFLQKCSSGYPVITMEFLSNWFLDATSTSEAPSYIYFGYGCAVFCFCIFPPAQKNKRCRGKPWGIFFAFPELLNGDFPDLFFPEPMWFHTAFRATEHTKKNPMADGDVAPVLVLKLGVLWLNFRVPKQKGTTKNGSMFIEYMIYL